MPGRRGPHQGGDELPGGLSKQGQPGSCQQPGGQSRPGLNLREAAGVSGNRLRAISRRWALFWRKIDCKRR